MTDIYLFNQAGILLGSCS